MVYFEIVKYFPLYVKPTKIVYGIIVFWLALGVLVYSLYLIYDTQLIIGNVGVQYSIDDYCFAALNLYIDIIYLFIRILQLIGGGSK